MKSMNIIYLDTLFLVNFICDYILLLCTARVCGAEIRRGLIVIAASIGGVYACLCTLSQYPWLRQPVMQSLCSVLLCVAAFGREQRLLRCTATFLCISAMTGGVLSAISINIRETLYLPIDFKTTLLVFAVVYAILSLFFRRFPHLRRKELHRITITMNGRTIRFDAMRDTGNELFEPISNLPVLICETKLLQPLFPEIALSTKDPYILFFRLNEIREYENRMRLLPFRTISDSGILLGFKPDTVLIDNVEAHYIIAFSPTQFSPSAEYQAIF